MMLFVTCGKKKKKKKKKSPFEQVDVRLTAVYKYFDFELH